MIRASIDSLEDAFNAGDTEGCAAIYAAECSVVVNGGVNVDGGFTAIGRDALASFLGVLRDEYGGTNATFAVQSVERNTHKVQWHADGCSALLHPGRRVVLRQRSALARAVERVGGHASGVF